MQDNFFSIEFLCLKSLRSKVRKRPSGADQYALNMFLVPLFCFRQSVPRKLHCLGYVQTDLMVCFRNKAL